MASPIPSPEQTATNLITLLNERGQGDYIGESISQLEHCLQCANFGLQAGAPQDTILAGLLHDIGQFLPLEEAKDVQMGIGDGSVGRIGHETIGASYLTSLGFAPSVTKLVGSHVAAKRYLTAIDKNYYEALSEASKQSLKFQGGPFEGQELEDFERDPLKDEMVRLRRWDDGAKVVGVEESMPRAEVYWGMIVQHLEGR